MDLQRGENNSLAAAKVCLYFLLYFLIGVLGKIVCNGNCLRVLQILDATFRTMSQNDLREGQVQHM